MTNSTLKNDQKVIQQALELLEEKQPGLEINRADFYCKVWRNTHSVAVELTRIVRYIPLGSKETDFEFDIVVNLSNKTILPFEDPFSGKFYVPSEKDLEALRFVKEHFGPFSTEFENAVIEEAEEYTISCTNEASFGHYSLNKNTGEGGPAIQGSYSVPPDSASNDPEIFPKD